MGGPVNNMTCKMMSKEKKRPSCFFPPVSFPPRGTTACPTTNGRLKAQLEHCILHVLARRRKFVRSECVVGWVVEREKRGEWETQSLRMANFRTAVKGKKRKGKRKKKAPSPPPLHSLSQINIARLCFTVSVLLIPISTTSSFDLVKNLELGKIFVPGNLWISSCLVKKKGLILVSFLNWVKYMYY